jgi:hypothetical protein
MNFYRNVRRHIPENTTLHSHQYDNLKFSVLQGTALLWRTFPLTLRKTNPLVNQASLARLGQSKILNAGKFIRDEVDARVSACCPVSGAPYITVRTIHTVRNINNKEKTISGPAKCSQMGPSAD